MVNVPDKWKLKESSHMNDGGLKRKFRRDWIEPGETGYGRDFMVQILEYNHGKSSQFYQVMTSGYAIQVEQKEFDNLSDAMDYSKKIMRLVNRGIRNDIW